MQIGSFVALGDSFTEGLDDPRADQAGYLGWADRFAQRLAVEQPGLRYANLAVRGKLLGQVATQQVPLAIAMAPDLVSLAAGRRVMGVPSPMGACWFVARIWCTPAPLSGGGEWRGLDCR